MYPTSRNQMRPRLLLSPKYHYQTTDLYVYLLIISTTTKRTVTINQSEFEGFSISFFSEIKMKGCVEHNQFQIVFQIFFGIQTDSIINTG